MFTRPLSQPADHVLTASDLHHAGAPPRLNAVVHGWACLFILCSIMSVLLQSPNSHRRSAPVTGVRSRKDPRPHLLRRHCDPQSLSRRITNPSCRELMVNIIYLSLQSTQTLTHSRES
ncbi:2-hydroxyacyl-CoA dehydratase [Sesbania bispinosa]|nr:2-hydroxyacyl-CoA dehydratase [Sesbania bispinosa]